MASFANKVVVITGASSGIGKAAAVKFASLGAKVALLARNVDNLNATVATMQAPAVHHVCRCDVTEEQQVIGAISSVVDKLGQIDVLINNAGVLVGASAQTTSTAVFDANFNVNTRGAFLVMQQCIPHLQKTRGNIVNVSSCTGMQSFCNTMAYCSSKAALDMMTKCAAVDLAPDGVRVNSVNPGAVRSELQKRGGLDEAKYQAFLERCVVTHPIGRIAEPEEIAEALSFLADNEKAGFITGATLPIDGGRLCLGAR